MNPKFTHRKIALISSAAAAYGGGAALLYLEWYKNYPSTSFHFHNDLAQWNQSDKYGHIFTAYYQARVWKELLLWSGKNPLKASYWSSGISFMAMNTIEIFDGISAEWGASVSDIAANGLGTGIFLAQELIWGKQKVKLKYSYSSFTYSDPVLQARARELYGNSIHQKILKDYNGTSMWFCISRGSLLGKSVQFPWVGAAVGIGNGGMFGAELNQFTLKNGIYYDYSYIPRYRSFFISPDIDLEFIQTNKKWLKTILFLANGIKWPLPTLEINTRGNVRFYPFLGIRGQVTF